MVSLLQRRLSVKKKVPFALSKLYGVGLSYSVYLCRKIGLNYNSTLQQLLSTDLRSWRRSLIEDRLVGNALRRNSLNNIKKHLSIRSYRGVRHFEGMPVRGQNTKSNARTAKRLLGRNTTV